MNQATFLISRYLIKEYPVLQNLDGLQIREMLHRVLRCPRLWEKMALLQSGKYTKQYQAKGLLLERFDFYPFPEDWCMLSILSNGSGFSRCFIFVYLLRYEIGDLRLDDDGTPVEIGCRTFSKRIFCGVGLDKYQMIFQRKIQTEPRHPRIPRYAPIWLYK